MEIEILDYIFHHVFLPVKLPQQDDQDEHLSSGLLAEVVDALEEYDASNEEWTAEGRICRNAILNLQDLRDGTGTLDSEMLESKLLSLQGRGGMEVLPIQIRSQNAAILILASPPEVTFESFELSSNSAAVFSNKGRMRRAFPAFSISLSRKIFDDASFQRALRGFIAEADATTVEEMCPKVCKSNSEVKEVRDTTDPSIVNEFFMGVLAAIGQKSGVQAVVKNIRDDVLWSDAYTPWRRSPLWLLIRVTLQRCLSVSSCRDDRRATRYKQFMVFFMGRMLDRAVALGCHSDMIFQMIAKISRRIAKAQLVQEGSVHQVMKILEKAERYIQRRWTDIQAGVGTQKYGIMYLPSTAHTQLSLPTLGPYIQSLNIQRPPTAEPKAELPHLQARIDRNSDRLPDPRLVVGNLDIDTRRNWLADVETWVERYLSAWASRQTNEETVSKSVVELMRQYQSHALKLYSENTEDFSIMVLNLMDLWAVLDTKAIRHLPLLRKYRTPFPRGLLDALLLPKLSQMKRLTRIEDYLEQRDRIADLESRYCLYDCYSSSSFATKYVNRSPHHTQLRRTIEKSEENRRAEKISELARLKSQYQRLVDRATAMQCDYEEVRRKNKFKNKHRPSCSRCALQAQAQSLSIEVHEWCLPREELQSKAVVFELEPPLVYSRWREVTCSLLINIFSPKAAANEQRAATRMYSTIDSPVLKTLSRYPPEGPKMLSTAKPFIIAHYGTQKVSIASKQSVCVNQGMHFELYFESRCRRLSDLLRSFDIAAKCVLPVPDGKYAALRHISAGTTHTSNEIIADQWKCSDKLTLDEFYSFGTLRCGHRLQLINIAREIQNRGLDLQRDEVNVLITNAIWQANPKGDSGVRRESHFLLDDRHFAADFIKSVTQALPDHEGNWHGAVAVRTLTILAQRVLSLSTDPHIQDQCLGYLKRCRGICLGWMEDLQREFRDSQEEEERQRLRSKILEVALTTHLTFDVDEEHVNRHVSSVDDMADYIQCSITVHDHLTPSIHGLTPTLRTLWQRFSRVSHRLSPRARKRILAECRTINAAVLRIWPAYRPSQSWHVVRTDLDDWMQVDIPPHEGERSVQVSYNLLNGSLLVNGIPLSRLPNDYQTHQSYQRLLGQRIIEVVPSRIQGMSFQARSNILGNEIHFHLEEGHLVVRMITPEGHYELLPLDRVNGNFPHQFVHNYIYWLDLDSRAVQLRPVKSPWPTFSDEWHMRPSLGCYSLERQNMRMIDLNSDLAMAVYRLLTGFEQCQHIQLFHDSASDTLCVRLPRLRLHFHVQSGQMSLHSSQYGGMQIDTDQRFGTMMGLESKLVLRDCPGWERKVLIPRGKAKFRRHGEHVSVDIRTDDLETVPYSEYRIDPILGRLVGDRTLISELWKAYIHGLTAHCLPDTLTGRTGTEEALAILNSGLIASCFQITDVELELLSQIADLAPSPSFYPRHLRVMQEVQWQNLPPMSHHERFHSAVKAILHRADEMQIFSEEPSPSSRLRLSSGDEFLLHRAAIRKADFRTPSFGAEDSSTAWDHVYEDRGARSHSIRGQKVSTVARLAFQWTAQLQTTRDLLHVFEKSSSPIMETTDLNFTLGYHEEWLDGIATLLPGYWRSWTSKLSQTTAEHDKYDVMFFLSTLAYSRKTDISLVETLMAMASVPELQFITPSMPGVLDLGLGYEVDTSMITQVIKNNRVEFSENTAFYLTDLPGESPQSTKSRRDTLYWKERGSLLNGITDQWPSKYLHTPYNAEEITSIRVDNVMNEVRPHYDQVLANHEFRIYIRQIENLLPHHTRTHQEESIWPRPHVSWNTRAPEPLSVDLFALMANASLEDIGDVEGIGETKPAELCGQSKSGKLESLLKDMSTKCSKPSEESYLETLNSSLLDLQSREQVSSNLDEQSTNTHVVDLQRQEDIVQQKLKNIVDVLLRDTAFSQQQFLKMGMGARLTPYTLLEVLSQGHRGKLKKEWRDILIKFGLSVAELQKCHRFRRGEADHAVISGSSPKGQRYWDPKEHVDWLLFELDNDLSIRRVQAEVAEEMIHPHTGSNSTLQLNMGEGKTSVIIPMVATELADQAKLLRVIVLRQLTRPMFYGLVSRLGGLINRRIFCLPFSRALTLDYEQVVVIRRVLEECLRTGGVLLMQPEQILSFELLGFDYILSDREEAGQELINTRMWLDEISRDVLDESDELLSVRFELICTMGAQQEIDFSPERWLIVQEVLEIVPEIAKSMVHDFPDGIDFHDRGEGSFPLIRILSDAAGHALIRKVADCLSDQGMRGLPIWRFSKHARELIRRLITKFKLSDAAFTEAKSLFKDQGLLWKHVLVLRGLIARDILRFVFQGKRWRVDYGLDLTRSVLAVPYNAKDQPSPRSEYSHPDVTIALTCLSYYLGGLSDEQLTTSFETLTQSESPEDEYSRWIQHSATIESAYRTLAGVNLHDTRLVLTKIFPSIRYSKAAIDFYLSHHVFPYGMREFPQKLSSSGWDLARTKTHPTTGFSGTNDSSALLPLSIQQHDLASLSHTNAAVMNNILQEQNEFHSVAEDRVKGQSWSILRHIVKCKPPIRVLIDVGAQMLEYTNKQVAEHWLEMLSGTEDIFGAIFFDDGDNVMVIDRSGNTENFAASPYSKHLNRCVVYLDQVHTRGTDFRFPPGSRAAVTLSLGLTKDQLVQACMRMRKLGQEHSVVLMGSHDVQNAIRAFHGLDLCSNIQVSDVLAWCIYGTWQYIQRCMPLWAVQGIRFHEHQAIWDQTMPGSSTPSCAEKLLEPEARTLDGLYGNEHGDLRKTFGSKCSQSTPTGPLALIVDRCHAQGVHTLDSSSLHEEQERELSPEHEEERQVERPQPQKPLQHVLDPDVIHFASTGFMRPRSRAFLPLWDTVKPLHLNEPWPSSIWATQDFRNTIVISAAQDFNWYLRPVNWILVSDIPGGRAGGLVATVISPFEAHGLLPRILNSKHVTLCTYASRVRTSTPSLEDLSLCTVPPGRRTPHLPDMFTTHLNLFSGQLYFTTYSNYVAACQLLGFLYRRLDVDLPISSDGFVPRELRPLIDPAMVSACPFQTSQIRFLQWLFSLRRKGRDYRKSHVGRMLKGDLIEEREFVHVDIVEVVDEESMDVSSD